MEDPSLKNSPRAAGRNDHPSAKSRQQTAGASSTLATISAIYQTIRRFNRQSGLGRRE
jgi:hypothetical protein